MNILKAALIAFKDVVVVISWAIVATTAVAEMGKGTQRAMSRFK